MSRLLFLFLVPGGLLVLAAVLCLELEAVRQSLAAFAGVYPYVVFASGILLGWRFDRSRVVFSLVVLALGEEALLRFAAGEAAMAGSGRVVVQAVAVLLPLNLLVLSLIKERGILTGRGLLRLGVILVQLPVVALLARSGASEASRMLEVTVVTAGRFEWLPLAQPALFSFALAGAVFVIRFLQSRNPIESGFLWALIAAFLAVSAGRGGLSSTVHLTTAGLILVISLIEATYTMAYRDELTQLPARRALNEALSRLSGRYAVAMVDIDHFKKFNDLHGHDVGDQLLRMIGAKLAGVSGGGRAFRYGGEEFTVLFPDKSVEVALPHLEALREAIEATRFTVRGRGRPRKRPEKPKPKGRSRKQVSVTVSMGVAEGSGREGNPDQVVKAADQALYRAKKAGRNQVRT